jgi:HEAT repeat protein
MLPLPSFGTNAHQAVPFLVRCIDDPADDVCYGAAEMLGRMRLEPDQSVPALIHCLNKSPNPMARAAAAESLGRFRNNAMPAVPSLHAALTDTNSYVQLLAKEALLKIAPQTLTNTPPK